MVLLKRLIVLILIVSFVSYQNNKTSYGSSSDKIEFFDKDSKPHGTSFEEWAAEWWNWINSIPMKDNPRLDNTGVNCTVNQDNNSTWFLAQVSDGYVERNCSIPYGKSIFVPILTGGCDYLTSPEIRTESGLSECASGGIKGATVKASIDGVLVQSIEKVKTPLFNTTIYPDNIFSSMNSITGDTQAVTDGSYLFIKSLPPGTHTLVFSASAIDNPIIGSYSFWYEVKYVLNIGPHP